MEHEIKFDDRPLNEIAENMVDWCLARGCQKLGETDKEYRVQCPDPSCPSRTKGEIHKAFDINKDTAQFHCFHCGLSGQGLQGPSGLIAQLEGGGFTPSATSSRPTTTQQVFSTKPKKKAEVLITKNEYEEQYQGKWIKEASEYLIRKHGAAYLKYIAKLKKGQLRRLNNIILEC